MVGFADWRRAAWRLCGPLACLPLIGACTVGPDFKAARPWWSPASWTEGKAAAPVSAKNSQPVAEKIDPDWWKLFSDRELTSLEERVAQSSLDLKVASSRFAQSRSQLVVAQSSFYPTLNANGSYSREYLSPNGVIAAFPTPGSGSSFGSLGSSANGLGGTVGGIPSNFAGPTKIPPFNLWQSGFDATWEIDLWGQIRRQVEVAKASVDAAEEQLRDSLVIVLAEVARDYVQLRGTQRNIEIVNENLASEQESLRLTEERASSGLTNDLDVANAEAQVTSTAAQLPALRNQEAQLINALSLLLGQPPNALRTELVEVKPIPPVPPKVPIGLPSELARRRPDIRAAEAQLHAATAQIGVAISDFFPNVSLTGSFGFQAIDFNKAFDWSSRQYGFGPTFTVPLFQGGRLVSTLALRKEQEQEAALSYQRTVLQALHDVDNALTAYTTEQQRQEQLAQTVEASRRALDLARQRYLQGIATFLDVLDAQRTVLAAEQQLTDSTTNVSTNLVALYKALGGGWENAYPKLPLPDAPKSDTQKPGGTGTAL